MTKLGKFLAGLLAATALGAGAAAAANSTVLFEPAPASQSGADKAPWINATSVVREQLVVINSAVLAQQLLPPEARSTASREAVSLSLPGEIVIPLFDGDSARVRRRMVDATLDDGLTWTGDIDGGAGFAILSIAGDAIVGVVQKDRRNYRIQPAGGGGLHFIVELAPFAPPVDEVTIPPGIKGAVDDGREPDLRATTTIKILAAFTQQSLTYLASQNTTATQAVALDLAYANAGLANSGIPGRFKLVGTKSVSGSFNDQALGNPRADMLRSLNKVTSGKSDNFRAIRRKRNAVNADLVAMYVMSDPLATTTCGQGWLYQGTAQPQFGFSVVNAPCIFPAIQTLAHELGHNLGGDHDRYVLLPNTYSNSKFRFGYVNLQGAFYDIMAYPNQCAANFINCAAIPNYANPNRLYLGFPTGIAQGLPGAAHAARTIKGALKTVAGYQ